MIKPDISSLREMSWLKSKSLVVMADVYDPAKNIPLAISPRNILQKQIDEMKKIGIEAITKKVYK